ncbi:GmrSD restriction endonuclease domain-containing protein [Salinarimonas soli]|uniref:GmrSD restriction endonuclease domain-containing protein n=1 Tax=Salinarimonas soli TaxID=1638099 RepID=UPI001AEE5588|nr:DUF262 domain-containing protein [Salinarimonas soli]
MDPEEQLSIDLPISPEQVALAEAQIVEQTKRIEFYVTDYSVELLADKMANGDFQIPGYQREDTWEPERKSRFLESILMGLPIPFLFFWEHPDTGRLEIVDGSQRLRTIHDFIKGDLRLGDLDELSMASGLRYRDLPESRQRKIKNRSIRGIILNEHADEEARFDLFERINTGSLIANKAEVRRGALVGPFLELVIELAKDSVFVDLAPVPPRKLNLREREEFVTRFFAYGHGLEGYRDRVAQFLYNYAKKANARLTEDPAQAQVLREDFARTMAFVARTFPYGFRRQPAGTDTPRTRFEAIAVGSYLALQERPDLEVDPAGVRQWLEDDAFKKIVGSDGANAISRLKGRINFVRKRLLEA